MRRTLRTAASSKSSCSRVQPVHQRIAVDEQLPGRGMKILFLQQVDAQGVQQGGAVGLVVLLQAAQHKATVS